MAKVLDNRIGKLSTLLDSKKSQLNEISIKYENEINEASDNLCPSTIKVNPISMADSNQFKVYSSNKKHKCETCKQTFKTSTQLTIHNRIHSKHKPFACDQCQMSFSTKGSLTIHKILHTGEKPYHCDLCPKKFALSHHLKSHKRTHTGEKPYACDLCPKKFSQSHCLNEHKRIHSGEKPYKCLSQDLILTKSYARSYNFLLENLSKNRRFLTRSKKILHGNLSQIL